MLAAMHVGRPVCTVSSAYCRLTKDYSKIHGILNAGAGAGLRVGCGGLRPGAASAALDVVAVFSQGADDHPGALAFDSAAAHRREPGGDGGRSRPSSPTTMPNYLLTSVPPGIRRW